MNRLRSTPITLLQTAVLMAICGCAYPISQEMRAQANPDLTYPVVARDPLAYKGATVIWGGVVLRVQNNPGQTELTILETPLDFWGRPQGSDYGRGRFIARVAKYLDPEVYGDKNRVVLAGEIVGEKIRPIDEIQYRYPAVRASELHLFPAYDYRSRYYPDRYEYWYNDQSLFRGIR
jgi:outer membrane lipoprotein